jgi:uroporphyrin-III C-methyltransferase/precorrin-2 dehydrogenase/sirohydrochlorin ferrochelatase
VPFGYPVYLELSGRTAVVIGATAVREGKVEGLLAADVGSVVVVVEQVSPRLESLAGLDGRVTIERRRWREQDLDGAFICVASSDDPLERSAIARAARARGVIVNVMDDIPNCDWAAPAIVRRGELVLAISTGGASPALAKKLRALVAAEFGEEWSEVVGVLRAVRRETMPTLPDLGERARRWAAALDLSEAATLVRQGRGDELHRRLVERLLAEPTRDPGTVYLVGAGPGDPKLITVRGAEVLGVADVVVYDRLASPALLDLAPETSERIYAGKEPGRSAMRQPEIDALLIERALAGQRVVRLKGGDPFVFGRGGEEALACVRAGVAFEVVPGVSSAVAAPALAGIPVTHRGLAQSFAVVTGSTAHGEQVDLGRVATATDTLVVLMAAGRLAATCAELIASGRRADEPAAIVQWAATPEQRTVVGTLERLPALAAAARFGPPATLVVGAVAELAAELGARPGIPSPDGTGHGAGPLDGAETSIGAPPG